MKDMLACRATAVYCNTHYVVCGDLTCTAEGTAGELQSKKRRKLQTAILHSFYVCSMRHKGADLLGFTNMSTGIGMNFCPP